MLTTRRKRRKASKHRARLAKGAKKLRKQNAKMASANAPKEGRL
jgi:hypothetical protein